MENINLTSRVITTVEEVDSEEAFDALGILCPGGPIRSGVARDSGKPIGQRNVWHEMGFDGDMTTQEMFDFFKHIDVPFEFWLINVDRGAAGNVAHVYWNESNGEYKTEGYTSNAVAGVFLVLKDIIQYITKTHPTMKINAHSSVVSHLKEVADANV